MSDLDKIRREQIQAGEEAVIRNLERNGLIDLVNDGHFGNREEMIARYKAIKADLARVTAENEALRKDAERLVALAWPEPFCDEFGGVDIHEEASVAASAFGRDEPTKDDYIAALRTAIDAAIKEGS